MTSTIEPITKSDEAIAPDLPVSDYPLDQRPSAVYLARLTSDHSKRNMRRHLDSIAALLTGGQVDSRALAWGALRYQHTQAIRARLMGAYSPATVNVMLSALRGVLKEAWRLGHMSAEDYQRAVDIENVDVETIPAGRDLSQGEIMALTEACLSDTSPAGVRDAAIIGILYTCGLRRAEVANLGVTDYNRETGQLKVMNGKGGKDRTVYVTNGAQAALHDWLAIRGNTWGALFTPVNKGGKVSIHAMTDQAIYNMLEKRGSKQAKLNKFTPHDLRRTFVGDMLDRGVDIVTVQKIAGHASPDTTARYDRRPEEVKKQAAQKLHFPYRKRDGDETTG